MYHKQLLISICTNVEQDHLKYSVQVKDTSDHVVGHIAMVQIVLFLFLLSICGIAAYWIIFFTDPVWNNETRNQIA